MDYKRLPDSELAKVMVNYITRIEHLQSIIARGLDGSDCGIIPDDRIKDVYKQLKNELREDAKYLNLVRNQNGSELYKHYFSPSIFEASACGFMVPVNRTIDEKMFRAVAEARYRLTKLKTLKEWEKLM